MMTFASRVHACFLIALFTAFALGAGARPVAAKDPVYTSTFSDLAVSGYDPVAYFTQGKPVEGDPAFELEWNGATWRFATQDNLDTFRKDPESYAPQYGGYCAWAVSQGYTASSDPSAWRIVNGKLYLNYSASIQQRWEKDIPGHIQSAEANWPEVLE
jgi:YHS domain-containing protein